MSIATQWGDGQFQSVEKISPCRLVLFLFFFIFFFPFFLCLSLNLQSENVMF